MNSGYSKTPLEKKLGLKDGFTVKIVNAPEHYTQWLTSLDIALYQPEQTKKQSIDFIHVFCKTLEDLEVAIQQHKSFLKFKGMLWVSWPKGSSVIATNLKREPIRDYVLANGLVDVKVAAIDDDWSGLKFVYRLTDRK